VDELIGDHKTGASKCMEERSVVNWRSKYQLTLISSYVIGD